MITPEMILQLVATLTPMVIGYFRLNARIVKLETENKELKKDNQALQSQNKKLAERVEHLEGENRSLWERLVQSGNRPQAKGVW